MTLAELDHMIRYQRAQAPYSRLSAWCLTRLEALRALAFKEAS